MMKRWNTYTLAILLLVPFIISCEKEYSYEGGGNIPQSQADSTLPITDTSSVKEEELATCSLCGDSAAINEFSWSFKTGHSLLCGMVDTAIINAERTALTFFGPSTCAEDSGLIFTVYLSPVILNKDIINLDASHAIFYYYDTFGPYVLTSHYDQPFRLTINSYVHSTGIAIGTFSGIGFRQDGSTISVTEGKFKIKLQ
jgi:hypothetical protein